MRTKTTFLVAASVLATATPAAAEVVGPIMISDNVELDIIGDARVRVETVDQDNGLNSAAGFTVRTRLGTQLKTGGFSLLVEGEGTLQLVDNYNDTIPSNGLEPYPVIADPQSLELNRAQVSYMVNGDGITVGRQRINQGSQRFVGSVGWRQNEQTFDAVRGQFSLGSFSVDATYSMSQRTIFGSESPNNNFDGDFLFFKTDYDGGIIDISGFAYLIDYDTRLAFSSDTYGVDATLKVPGTPLTVKATYATQNEAGSNPTIYDADYYFAELGASVAGFNLAVGYEELGSDGGVAAFQTPLATLHKFNGFADLFLRTPNAGLRDYYGKISKKIAIPGVTTFTATVFYHEFEADFGGASYGSEFDAVLGFKSGDVSFLLKYANYDADGFGVDTEKFWFQAGISI